MPRREDPSVLRKMLGIKRLKSHIDVTDADIARVKALREHDKRRLTPRLSERDKKLAYA